MNKTYRVTYAYIGNMKIEAFESGKKVLDIIVNDYNKAGKVDWKEEKKSTMSYVVIPKDLFYRFMENEIMTEKWVAMGFIATEDDEDLIEED